LKYVSLVSKWVFILCIPLLLISSSLAWGFNSQWLYNFGFDKYNVSLQTGFSPVELDKAANGLIKYFNSNEEYVDIVLIREGQSTKLFSREEQLHFKDVKQLVRLDYLFLIVSLIVISAYTIIWGRWRNGNFRKTLARRVIWGCSLSILIITIIGIASYFNFDQLFLQFHYLVFSNQYWSAPGYMLLLFPGGFWFDAALICGAFMSFFAIVLGVASVLYLKLGEREIKIY
jgi:integral membrane protein (TIGR01906 family)